MLPPFWGVERPPYNLAVLAAYLRAGGLRVEVEDLNVRAFRHLEPKGLGHLWTIGTLEDLKPMALYHMLLGPAKILMEQAVEKVLSSETRVVGLFINSANRHAVRWVAERIREEAPGRIIVLGGPEVLTLLEEGTLHRFAVDHFVLGEGEETLLEICRRELSDGPTGTIPGAIPGPRWMQQEPHSARFLRRPPPANLDGIPFPTYEEFDLESYTSKELPFAFSRGCPARCVFCIDCELMPDFRCRSGAHAVAEMAHHMRRHGRKIFTFNDLICNGDMDRLTELAHLIMARRLEPVWSSYAMIRPEMTPELLAKLKAAGCAELHYGFESGSDQVLRRMRKPYSVKLAEQVIHRTAEAGIRVGINVIVGFPGETEQDLQATIDFLRNNRTAIFKVLNISSLALLQGSAMAREPEQWGVTDKRREAWVDDHGLCEAERRDRLTRVLDTLDELKLPLKLINCTHKEKYYWAD